MKLGQREISLGFIHVFCFIRLLFKKKIQCFICTLTGKEEDESYEDSTLHTSGTDFDSILYCVQTVEILKSVMSFSYFYHTL